MGNYIAILLINHSKKIEETNKLSKMSKTAIYEKTYFFNNNELLDPKRLAKI